MSELHKHQVDISVPAEATYIVNQLDYSGYEAYLVGGCVRDSLLGRTPHDWDICTNATPEQIKDIFQYDDIIETGLKHGTVTIMVNREPFEVTTFRSDGEYSDHRHPDKVEYVTSLYEDLSRRDFTINAMAYNSITGELIDYFNGMSDLKACMIRCVGNPNDRFNEDALRMLRAIRFSVVLGASWSIAQDILDAIEENALLLNYVSKERISEELTKMFSVQNYRAFPITVLLGLLGATVVPELTYYQSVNTQLITFWDNIATQVCFPKPEVNLITNLSILLHFKPDVQANILKRLKFSNDVINGVTNTSKAYDQLKNHFLLVLDGRISPQEYTVKCALRDFGPTIVKNAIMVLKSVESSLSDSTTCADDYLSAYNLIMDSNDCYSLKDLAINGCDVLKQGYSGKEVGVVLNTLLDKVMRREVLNKRDSLIREIRYIQAESNQ